MLLFSLYSEIVCIFPFSALICILKAEVNNMLNCTSNWQTTLYEANPASQAFMILHWDWKK